MQTKDLAQLRKILEEKLKENLKQLNFLLEEIKLQEIIRVGKPESNNEEELNKIRLLIVWKNIEVEELQKKLNKIIKTIEFRTKHPRIRIAEFSGMYTGRCEVCKGRIPYEELVRRYAPNICVRCANKK